MIHSYRGTHPSVDIDRCTPPYTQDLKARLEAKEALLEQREESLHGARKAYNDLQESYLQVKVSKITNGGGSTSNTSSSRSNILVVVLLGHLTA